MKKNILQELSKAWDVVRNSDEHWRLTLFLQRKKLDLTPNLREVTQASERALMALEATALLHPEALELAVVKIRRLHNSARAMKLVQQTWTLHSGTSQRYVEVCANSWYLLGKMKECDEAVRYGKLKFPRSVEIWLLDAKRQKDQGGALGAIEAWKRALEMEPSSQRSEAWALNIGQEYFRLQDYASAVHYLARGISSTTSAQPRYELANALEHVGETERAEELYLSLEKSSLPSDVRRAELHSNFNNLDQMLESLVRLPDSYDRDLLLSRAHLKAGNYSEVIDLIGPESSSVILSEYRALALELSERRIDAFQEYKRIMLFAKGVSRRARVLQRLSRVAYFLDDYDSVIEAELAIDQFFPALKKMQPEIDPRFAAYERQARTCLDRGLANESISALAQMGKYASTRANLESISRVMGWLLASVGQKQRAAQCFFLANPIKTPNVSEINRVMKPLSAEESYYELYETLGLAEKTIVYESFHGLKTACSPLAICLQLLKDPAYADYKHIWFVKDGAPVHPGLLADERVSILRYDSFAYRVYLASAEYLINNSTFPDWFVRREDQKYLNTWHGIPWKHMGRDVTSAPFGYRNVGRNFLQATHLIFPGKHTRDSLLRSCDAEGITSADVCIDLGTPRLDLTMNLSTERREQIIDQLGVREGKKRVLYAPTWRDSQNAASHQVEQILSLVERLSASDVEVLIRAHHFARAKLAGAKVPANAHLVADDIDTNELLAVTDLLISDYSSIMFDFSAVGGQVIKYVYDLDEYTNERGLYFPIDQVPGLICHSLEELEGAVTRWISGSTNLSLPKANPTLAADWRHEDGKSSQRTIDRFFNKTKSDNALSVKSGHSLISVGGLRPNGISRSLKNLAANVSYGGATKYRIFIHQAAVLHHNEAEAVKLNALLPFTLHTGILRGTRHERNVWADLMRSRLPISDDQMKAVQRMMSRQRRAYFGDTTFESVLEFDGHSTEKAAFIGTGFPDVVKSTFVVHSNFYEELKHRFPQHRSTGKVLSRFDTVASVSAAVLEENRRSLHEMFGVEPSRNKLLPNTIDVVEIEKMGAAALDPDIQDWFRHGGPTAVMVGRLSAEKNHALAIRALAHQRATSNRPARLLIVGDGPTEPEIRALVEEYGLSDNVFLAGYRENPYPMIKHADGLLLCSTHEGQPMVFLEAMTLRTRIASTNIAAAISVLENGRHGLLVDQSQAGVCQAIDAIANHVIPVASFHPSEYAAQALRTFEDIVAGGAGKAHGNG